MFGFLGNMRTGLEHYADNQNLASGHKNYPDADEFENPAGEAFGITLGDIPDTWVISSLGSNKVDFVYTPTDPNTVVRYECSGDDTYSLSISSGPSYMTEGQGSGGGSGGGGGGHGDDHGGHGD